MAINFNDPLYPANIAGYTNQNDGTIGSLVANIPTVNTLGTDPNLVEPAALSGYLARSLDPDVTTAGGAGTTLTLTLGTVFLVAVNILGPALTSKVVVPGKTAGPPTHAWAALYSASTGAQVAITADQGASGFGTATAAINWTSATLLNPGVYWVALLEVGGTAGTVQSFTLSTECQVLLSGAAGKLINYVVGGSLRFGTGVTGLTSLSTMPNPLTATMTASATATGTFVGLA